MKDCIFFVLLFLFHTRSFIYIRWLVASFGIRIQAVFARCAESYLKVCKYQAVYSLTHTQAPTETFHLGRIRGAKPSLFWTQKMKYGGLFNPNEQETSFLR